MQPAKEPGPGVKLMYFSSILLVAAAWGLFYILPMTLIPLIHILIFHSEDMVSIFCVIFFDIFNLFQINLAHHYLRKSCENEVELPAERDKPQSLIDAVAGFVSFINEDLRYRAINEFGKNFYKEDKIIGQEVGFMYPDSTFSKFVHLTTSSSKSRIPAKAFHLILNTE